eukprot:gene4962-10450_t
MYAPTAAPRGRGRSHGTGNDLSRVLGFGPGFAAPLCGGGADVVGGGGAPADAGGGRWKGAARRDGAP